MKIALASDHGGYQMKESLKNMLLEKGYDVTDFGCQNADSVDYPDFSGPVCQQVVEGKFDRGILICGTGIGMSMSANKVAGVRCALAHDTFSARMTRAHNDSNVLAMGERVIGIGLAEDIVDIWLQTPFEGGRHGRRVDKMMNLEKQEGKGV